MNVTVNPIKPNEIPVVAWHDGGQMFAGDEQPYEKGWYFYPGNGRSPILVNVIDAPEDANIQIKRKLFILQQQEKIAELEMKLERIREIIEN